MLSSRPTASAGAEGSAFGCAFCRPYRTRIVPRFTQRFAVLPQFAQNTARIGDPGPAACWARLFRAYGASSFAVVFQGQMETPVNPAAVVRGWKPLPFWGGLDAALKRRSTVEA
jgi:hypothetical protein